jgi:hypothetical protein
VARRSSARRSPTTEILGIGSRSKKGFLWRLVRVRRRWAFVEDERPVEELAA